MSLERVAACVSAVFFVAAIAAPRWVEALSGLSPDAGSGKTELIPVVIFGLAALLPILLANVDRLKLKPLRPINPVGHHASGR
jgi:hypothetical protein